MAMTAREAAWTALQRWRKNGAWSDAALHAVLQNAQLEPRDAALAARICYGTLQNLTLLDHYLSIYCTTPLQKLEPKVLDLLRLSAYQIVLLDKIPPRAAVNEAVALCRKGGCARASGLVNAVLRRVAEHRDALPEIPGAGTADYLAVRYSHPRWLAQRYIDAHGYAFAERALAANNADAPACLQVNPMKTTADALMASLHADGIEAEPHPWLPDALLCHGGNLAAARAFADGWFYVQDAAAHCAALVSGVAEGCVQSGCALIGGETAEHPGSMSADDYDLAGFAVGIVDRAKIIDHDRMRPGDVVIALTSSGIHSNGYSLVRKVFNVEHADLGAYVDELGCTLGEELLRPTKIYVKPVLAAMDVADVHGVSHITGGGFYENIPRCIPDGLCAKIDKSALRTPPIFSMLQRMGSIPEHDMFNTYNMGVGMTMIVAKDDADKALAALKENGQDAYVIGEVVSGEEKVALC